MKFFKIKIKMSVNDFISLHLEEIYEKMLQYRKCEKNYYKGCANISTKEKFTYNNTCTACHNRQQLDYQNKKNEIKNQKKNFLKNQVSQILETKKISELPQGIKMVDLLTTEQMTQIIQESGQSQNAKIPKLNVV